MVLSVSKRHPHKNVEVPFRCRFLVRGLWACQWFIIHVPKPYLPIIPNYLVKAIFLTSEEDASNITPNAPKQHTPTPTGTVN